MPMAFCSMTSRSARLLLSEQRKSVLLNNVLAELEDAETQQSVTVFTYENLRVVVEVRDQAIKIMTENEFRRLYPTLTTSKAVTRLLQKVA